MKLFYAPGSCSMASHITLEESGIPYETTRVNLKEKKTADGQNYLAINPKGYVPCVQLEDGTVLTENTALLPYLGELNPDSGLMPTGGSRESYRVREWLAYINGEVHKNCSPLFSPVAADAIKSFHREVLGKRLPVVDKALNGVNFLVGERFTVADAYLFVILSWFPRLNLDLGPYPNLKAFFERVKARPAVQKVLADEFPPQAA